MSTIDRIVFHFTGRAGNANSEAKCLCNLAFAHTQLRDYTAAHKSFTRAFASSDKAGNPYLKFQASEGLGAVSYLTGQFSNAVKHFQKALAVLDEIKQDTGIARERVREKLSDALEAEQKLARSQGTSSCNDGSGLGDVQAPHTLLSKRGRGALPPLDLAHSKGTARRREIVAGKHKDTSCDSELKAYVNTYREDDDNQSSNSSSEESVHVEPRLQAPPTPPETTPTQRSPREATPTQYVHEGSLAIGVDARELYTTHSVQGGRGRGRVKGQREIVPKATIHSEGADTQDAPTAHTQHSKVCIIV